jgi:RHS repeat-associated protein
VTIDGGRGAYSFVLGFVPNNGSALQQAPSASGHVSAASSQTVFSIGYDFHVGNGTTGADNGNVFGITNYKDTTHGRDQTFTYDLLNRLTSAQNAGTDCTAKVLQNKTEYWGNSYGYDAWGNMLQKSITKCGAENLIVTADAHNWVHASGTDYQYDAAGNMTFDATAGLNYTFDQENRLTGASGYAYTYDGDGNRVRKSNGSMGTLYWYMTPGIVGESDLSGNLTDEYVFFDGERVARKSTNGVFYYFSDHLKTASVVTDSLGNIKSESDFYPWGGELQFVNNDSNHYKFTGKERDTETGLDYFGARYYSNGLGRFVTSDWSATPVPVPYADLTDPQSLNQYSYVRNIPTVKTDADGHDGGTATDIQVDMEMVKQTLQQLGPAAGPTLAVAGTVGLAVLNVVGVGVLVHELVSPSTTVGQSNADERAAIQQGSQERAAQNGGVDPQSAPEPQASTSGAGARKGGGNEEKPGEVYVTEPQASGKPYVGRTTQGTDKRMQTRTDGRTGKATKVDTYKTKQEGRYKEQKAIDQNGGKQKLDNKRNEVAPDKMKDLDKKYGPQ